jgi:multidrug efflux pump subunit AcrA (membrane-fusion protein)
MKFNHSFARTAISRPGFSWTSVAIVVVLAGAAVVTGYIVIPRDEAQETPFESPVVRGPFVHEITERGELEASNPEEVRCKVESRGTTGTPILELTKEGSFVKKGDILAKLDSSQLTNELQAQEIVCNTSEASLKKAQADYDTAVKAKEEYLEGTYTNEEKLINSEIFVAKSAIFVAQGALKQAEEYERYGRLLAREGLVTAEQREADQFSIEKAKKDLEKAQNDLAIAENKLRVLRDFTKPKMLTQLQADIDAKLTLLKNSERIYKLDVEKKEKLVKQIDECTIRAHADGELVYANDRDRRSSDSLQIAEGAPVRERQLMFLLTDASQMRVKAKINESRIGLVRVGQPAEIRLDSRISDVMHGTVSRVDTYPIPNRWSSSTVKDYAVYIDIDDPLDGLRAGLTAQVTIRIKEYEDVLKIPVQAVYEKGEQRYCLVRKGSQRVPTKIKTGWTDDRFIVIEEGLKEGELVVQNPRKYIGEELDREAKLSAEKASDMNGNGRRPPNGQPYGNGAGRPPGGAGEAAGPAASGGFAPPAAGRGGDPGANPGAGGDERPRRPRGPGGWPGAPPGSTTQAGADNTPANTAGPVRGRRPGTALPETLPSGSEAGTPSGDSPATEAPQGRPGRPSQSLPGDPS